MLLRDFRHFKGFKFRDLKYKRAIAAGSFALLGGGIALGLSQAATIASSQEAENGVVTTAAARTTDATASGGAAIRFGTASTVPTSPLCSGSEYSDWSDAASWGGAVPSANALATVPVGKKIRVNIDVPHLNNLTIPAGAEVCFPDRATTFSAKQIVVMGSFRLGSKDNRIKSPVLIKLEGGVNGTDNFVATGQAATDIAAYNRAHGGDCIPTSGACISISTNIGTNVLTALNGGVIDMFGEERGLNWTKLATTAAAGSRNLSLMDAVQWRAGDVLALASSDMDPTHAEKVTVASVSSDGKTVTLAANLAFGHAGISTCLTSGTEKRCVDERSEVGLLTQSVKVAGPDNTQASRFGGHTIVLPGGQMHSQSVEMYNMGQEGILGKYPLHYHILGDDGANSYATNMSLHDNVNRQVTIHGSNKVRISGTVAYKSMGHSVMLEDGNEQFNVFTDNLIMGTQYQANSALRLRVSDEIPADFWLTNPQNDMVGNSAAGGQGTGIWWDFGYTDNFNVYKVQSMPFGRFDDNVSHSHITAPGNESLHVNGSGVMIDVYYGQAKNRKFANTISAWKNQTFGFWTHGFLDFSNISSANNGIGYNAEDMYTKGGIVLGYTANTGQDAKNLAGLVRFYHGQADVEDVWLGNFDNSTGKYSDGQLAAFNDDGAGITDAQNRIKNIKFFGNGWRVQHVFCGAGVASGDCYYGPTHGGNGHYIEDTDGSIVGDGVPAIITNAQFGMRHPQGKILYPNVTTNFYGKANRGLVTPLDRHFMAFATADGTRVVSDTDGETLKMNTWALTEMGKRYHVLDYQSSFSIRASYPGYIDLYFDKATKPGSVNKGGYNDDSGSRTNQKQASSLANLGKDGTWWWEGGKLYIRAEVTGTPIPFGRAFDNSSLSIQGDDFEYWSIH